MTAPFGNRSFDFVTHEGEAAQAIMPQVGYMTGAALSAVFDPNKLDGSTITAGTVTVSGTVATLTLSADEVDSVKDSRFTIYADTTVIAQGKVNFTPKPQDPVEELVLGDLAPVAVSGDYSDLQNTPDLSSLASATENAAADTLAKRDANGNISFSVVYLGAAQDPSTFAATRKDYVDGVGTSYADPNSIMRRESGGGTRLNWLTIGGIPQFDKVPINNNDAVRKDYVDASVSAKRGPNLPSGRYMQLTTDGNAAVTPPKGVELSYPFWLPSNGTIDSVSVSIGILPADATGAVLRLGVRADNSGLPGGIITETSFPIDSTGTSGYKTLSTSLSLPNTYWISVCAQTTGTNTVRLESTSGYYGPFFLGGLASARAALDWATGHGPVAAIATNASSTLASGPLPTGASVNQVAVPYIVVHFA